MPGIGTDIQLRPFELQSHAGQRLFLQTSPEFAMKRLLAAGSGPIYQLCKAFRDEEKGRRHNFEFTLLEWYRPGWDLSALMAEMSDFLQVVCGWLPLERLTYQAAFQGHLGFCPHQITLPDLRACLIQKELARPQSVAAWSREECLDCLLSHCIEPHLGIGAPCALEDYPAAQAALAKIESRGEFTVGRRFEIYFQGIELANGYDELVDAQEQRQRFIADNQQREALGLPSLPVDEALLAALEAGMPACSGVALGVDRLFMVHRQQAQLSQVQAFFEG